MFEQSRLNLARWFTLSMGSILVVFAGVLYLWEARGRLYFFDQALYNSSQVIASGVEEVTYGNQRRIDLEDAPILGSDAIKLDTNIIFARWYTPEKALLQFMGDIPAPTLDAELGFQTLHDHGSVSANNLRQLTLPVYRDGQMLGYLQVAASLNPVTLPLQQLRLFLGLGLPVALATIAFAGWLLGGRATQPIRLAYQQLQQFTADASHELRAPLAAIISNAQLGLMKPTSPAEQADCLKTISEAGESMSTLVGHLLFLARHQGQLPPEAFQPTDMVVLLASIAADYTSSIAAQELHFEVSLPEGTALVQGEPGLLRQAIANLLDNACRYTPAGGSIRLIGQLQPRWVCIRVEDSGSGIPAENLPHIFERFYRVDKERSRQAGGVGLGLAISRQIVELHGGQIKATSQMQQGSQFQIRLPLATPMPD
ncbi:two-component sensor histidine kinase [Nodosilinea sp. LEGE 06152]|uniref:sensor histidine kinase n=1 Tax=Nodosilinea sp. LEGE 06152 TaxID=2777966 RepID=UPI00187E3D8C|nr:ATP-binding protein [Nodosilinea sp. LEGE 06152]MBE9160593.1 two-component sensor histidine kinase [Nodosilinea sp. LEGE 06152]